MVTTFRACLIQNPAAFRDHPFDVIFVGDRHQR
jgi:hypothetical protein